MDAARSVRSWLNMRVETAESRGEVCDTGAPFRSYAKRDGPAQDARMHVDELLCRRRALLAA